MFSAQCLRWPVLCNQSWWRVWLIRPSRPFTVPEILMKTRPPTVPQCTGGHLLCRVLLSCKCNVWETSYCQSLYNYQGKLWKKFRFRPEYPPLWYLAMYPYQANSRGQPGVRGGRYKFPFNMVLKCDVKLMIPTSFLNYHIDHYACQIVGY